MLLVRSLLFTTLMFASVVIYAIPAACSLPLPHRVPYAIATNWSALVLWLARRIVGLRYVVEGAEHLPREPCVALLKHQSAWEAIAQLAIFPPQTWVLKRELLWIPFFGWGLRALKPIAIDRGAGASALEQVIEQGHARLSEGLWVMIFPEGTRVAAGRVGHYGQGGAALAKRANRPVVPVAHNAGEFWPRRGWLKRPGVIRVCIGPPIPTSGLSAPAITERAREWIEGRMREITAARPRRRETPRSQQHPERTDCGERKGN